MNDITVHGSTVKRGDMKPGYRLCGARSTFEAAPRIGLRQEHPPQGATVNTKGDWHATLLSHPKTH